MRVTYLRMYMPCQKIFQFVALNEITIYVLYIFFSMIDFEYLCQEKTSWVPHVVVA